MVKGAVVAAILVPASLGSALAEPAPPTPVAGVVVTAPAPAKAPNRAFIDSFVGAVGQMSLGDQLATWSRTALPGGPSAALGPPSGSVGGQPICPRVLGLPAPYAAFILARLREVGAHVDAPVSQKDCAPADDNLVIVFPTDAKAFVDRLAREKPQAFGFPDHGSLVVDLARPLPPIKAWYGIQVASIRGPPSRLSTLHVSVLTQALIVVDRDRTEALSMGQLSDHLAMIALADLRPDKVPPDAASILNLFADLDAGRPPAQALTPLDLAYLKALYAVDQRQTGVLQSGQIAGRIRRDLSRR